MEDSLIGALQAGGAHLADALRAGLAERGLPASVEIALRGNRLHAISRSREVVQAELGRPGAAPSAPMETIARAAAPHIARLIAARLQAATR